MRKRSDITIVKRLNVRKTVGLDEVLGCILQACRQRSEPANDVTKDSLNTGKIPKE